MQLSNSKLLVFNLKVLIGFYDLNRSKFVLRQIVEKDLEPGAGCVVVRPSASTSEKMTQISYV